MSKVNISAKKSGDKLTATEFNEVVDAVNDNDKRITAQAQQMANMNTSMENMTQKTAENTQTLKQLVKEHIPHEFYSQSEYDALVTAGRVNVDALTFVYED